MNITKEYLTNNGWEEDDICENCYKHNNFRVFIDVDEETLYYTSCPTCAGDYTFEHCVELDFTVENLLTLLDIEKSQKKLTWRE